MAEVEFAGVKFKGGKIFVIITALTTLGGGLWAGFEFYKDYLTMKNYGMTMREYTMRKITKTSKGKSTDEMIEDVSVEVPNVKEDDVSRIVGEMNEV